MLEPARAPRITRRAATRPSRSARLGAAAFLAGSALWLVDGWRAQGELDVAALAYTLGSALFLAHAFRARGAVYRAGAVLYVAGTLLWGVGTWHAAHHLDAGVSLYFAGCALFLVDAFAEGPWWTRAGSLAFVAGTAAWAWSAGPSVVVGAFALGCVFFVRDAFSKVRGDA